MLRPVQAGGETTLGLRWRALENEILESGLVVHEEPEKSVSKVCFCLGDLLVTEAEDGFAQVVEELGERDDLAVGACVDDGEAECFKWSVSGGIELGQASRRRRNGGCFRGPLDNQDSTSE